MKTEVVIRAVLYSLIAFLTPVAGVVVEATKNAILPDKVAILGALTGGFMAALVALRAFIDGTNERSKNGRQ